MSLTPDPNAVPHEGAEHRPPVLPPQRYEADPAGAVQPAADGTVAPAADAAVTPRPVPSTMQRLEAVSGPLGFALFMVCGFALDGWSWSWIFFLLPGILYAWNRAGHGD